MFSFSCVAEFSILPSPCSCTPHDLFSFYPSLLRCCFWRRWYCPLLCSIFPSSLLVKTAISVPCTIPIILTSFLSSASRLYEQRVFPVPATHASPHTIFILHGLQLVDYPFLKHPTSLSINHRVLASMLLIRFIASAIHTHIVRSFSARCHSRCMIMIPRLQTPDWTLASRFPALCDLTVVEVLTAQGLECGPRYVKNDFLLFATSPAPATHGRMRVSK